MKKANLNTINVPMGDQSIERWLGPYRLTETLGGGATSLVEIGFNVETQQYVALKFRKPKADEQAQKLWDQEAKNMSMLNHPNLPKLVDAGKAKYRIYAEQEIHRSIEEYDVDFIAIGICSGGELYDYIAESGPFSEKVARFYMKQALDALYYCHNEGLAHRDIKCENIFLDGDFNLILADLGFAAPMEGRDGSGILKTYLGTRGYMAPEIIYNKPYSGSQVDAFAIGVLLFMMVVACNPFKEANAYTDAFYRAIHNQKAANFWKAFDDVRSTLHPTIEEQVEEIRTYVIDDGFTLEEIKQTYEDQLDIIEIEDWWPQIKQIVKKFKPELIPTDDDVVFDKYLPPLSNEVKELITGLLQPDANKRPSIAEAIYHPWLAGETATKEEIFKEFTLR